MKKIICLIFFLVAQAVLADVVSARYDDEGVHFGLPGWVSMLPSDSNVLHKEVSTFEQDETCNHPGKSNLTKRRITFGRKPIPIQDIYIRVGVAKDSGVRIKKCYVTTEE